MKRFLRPEERALWNSVAASVDTGERATPAPAPTPRPSPPQSDAASASVPPTAIPIPPRWVPYEPAGAPKPAKKTGTDANRIEPHTARRIGAGRTDIEARIDLHGCTEDDARHRLEGFLVRAKGQGYRTVLVITGKGGPRDAKPSKIWDDRPRGLLRRLVPLWLAVPPLSTYVSSWSEAAQRHGGGGAFYVRLRK